MATKSCLRANTALKKQRAKPIYLHKKADISLKTDSSLVGKASVTAGAGRETLNDKIDYSAGVVLHRKTGDFVNKGDKIARGLRKKRKAFRRGRRNWRALLPSETKSR